jgi:hypothetical protein
MRAADKHTNAVAKTGPAVRGAVGLLHRFVVRKFSMLMA